MLTGGYQVVDFKGSAFTVSTQKTLDFDLYSKITKKALPLYVKGLKIGSSNEASNWVQFYKNSSSSYVGIVKVEESTHGLTVSYMEVTSANKAIIRQVELAEYSAESGSSVSESSDEGDGFQEENP